MALAGSTQQHRWAARTHGSKTIDQGKGPGIPWLGAVPQRGQYLRVVSPSDAVLIVTGGSTGPGGEIARAAANRGYAVVWCTWTINAEPRPPSTTSSAANGTAVAVRADLTDDLDVERLFQETVAMFGGVDIIVHTDSRGSRLIDQQAARHLRSGGAIVSRRFAARTAVGRRRSGPT